MKVLSVILCAVMFVLPSISVAGDYGCRTVHQNYSYSTPVYSAPSYQQSYVGYQQSYNTVYPYAIPVAILPSTFYQVAPELAQARIQAELVESAVEKALKRQSDQFERLTRGSYVQAMPYVSPGTYAIPPAANYEPPPGYKLVPIETGPAPPTPQIQPKAKESEPPAIPPVPAKDPVPPVVGKDGKQKLALDDVKLMVQNSCIKCHGGGNAHINLTNPETLTEAQLLRIEHRVMSLDPKVQMPPPGDGRKQVEDKMIGAVHVRINEVMAKQ